MSDLVKATWVGGFRAETPSGVLEPGDTHTLSRGEAEQSANWQIDPVKPTEPAGKGGEE
jgi:hypothetical protein